MSVEQKLISIAKDVFELAPNVTITMDLKMSDLPEWDSMGTINLVSQVEEEFKVQLPLERIAEIKSLKDIEMALIEVRG